MAARWQAFLPSLPALQWGRHYDRSTLSRDRLAACIVPVMLFPQSLAYAVLAGVILLLVASAANIFLQIPAMMIAISVIAIAIFSAFILYDVNRILTGGETNYITATLSIYLSVYNVFANLLSLLGIIGGDRD